MTVRFPDDFLWGASTSAYQIVGAKKLGRQGRVCPYPLLRTPGGRVAVVLHGTDTSCDHYHRMPEDVALMLIEVLVPIASGAWP